LLDTFPPCNLGSVLVGSNLVMVVSKKLLHASLSLCEIDVVAKVVCDVFFEFQVVIELFEVVVKVG
jgi:hypothetical protein